MLEGLFCVLTYTYYTIFRMQQSPQRNSVGGAYSPCKKIIYEIYYYKSFKYKETPLPERVIKIKNLN